MAPSRSDTLIVALDVPDRVGSNEPLHFTIRLENPTDRPLSLHLRGRQIIFDLIVMDTAGNTVWELLAGDPVMAILRLETLGPGDAIELAGTWDLRAADGSVVRAGTYSLQGVVPTDQPAPLRTPVVSVRVLDR